MKKSLGLPAAALAVALGLAACTAAEPPAPGASASVPAGTSGPPPVAGTGPFSGLGQKELDTKLIAAAWDDDVDTARELIAAGADVNAKDNTQQSAYLIAASEGYLRLLDLTLAHGADVKSLDSWQGTGLIRASERGHAAIVGRLLTAGIDPDHVNNLGWVGLHEALVFAKDDRVEDYRDTVRVLVAGGADVGIASQKDGRSPESLAEAGGLDAQAALLAEAGSAPEIGAAQAGRDLLRAAEKGDADAAALALRAGADIEARNDLKQTPLLLASAGDHPDVARLLVALGADPDALDYRHDTPWLVTGVTGSVAMLEALLPAEPDLTIVNRFGGLAPIPAGEHGHADYMRRVVTTGVDLDHVNTPGWTALLEAVIFGDGSKRYQDTVRALVDAGADVSIADKDGRTALDHAREKGQDAVAEILEG